ncbi:MAG: transglutaminase, partial [Rhodoglobus sp.]
MQRNVTSRLELDIKGQTSMVFSVAAASGASFDSESLRFELDGREIVPTELIDERGTRLHTLIGEAGTMVVEYSAQVSGRSEPAAVSELDMVTYLRPSRYCESDSLTPTARSEFFQLTGDVGHGLYREADAAGDVSALDGA